MNTCLKIQKSYTYIVVVVVYMYFYRCVHLSPQLAIGYFGPGYQASLTWLILITDQDIDNLVHFLTIMEGIYSL